jgi:predicted ATPase
MQITHLEVKNWRNFRSLSATLQDVTYVLGPNASGKSNLLDALRFLRDVSKPMGGGLQAAVMSRGGISKLRCLHARKDNEVLMDVALSASYEDAEPDWRYKLGFKSEGKGAQRILVSQEAVWKKGEKIFSRPDKDDHNDIVLRTQTRLEQITANTEFREISEFFGAIVYLHLVPQLLKFSDQIGGRRLEDDPFGQGFLERIAKTPEKTRNSRLAKINKALNYAVPQFQGLHFVKDDIGHPHLEARYVHHRPNEGLQKEEQFSDGTLRLIGLLWSFLDDSSMLLLEEPELSLNDSVVAQIPLVIQQLRKDRKVKRQVVISTHSAALLSNLGIDGRGVILLETGSDGSTSRGLIEDEIAAIKSGLSVAEVVLPRTHPELVNKLGNWR